MVFTGCDVAGAFIIDVEPRIDERGSFARTWCRRELEGRGLRGDFVQANSSHSGRKGTIRGLHYQLGPSAEVKLICCVKGSIWDVIVDLRPDSPTYLAWFGVELSSVNRRQMYVPEGCAHGFQTLVDDTEVAYPVSAFYAPDSERGLRWDDPRIAIEWPVKDDVTVSPKDRSWPDYVPDQA